MWVKHVYIPMQRDYRVKRGLSERQIKKQLESNGWRVYRGGFLHCLRTEMYPAVETKYRELERLMDREMLERLQYMCEVQHGMPDFLCYRGHFKFVECKLGHEQLSERQKRCIQNLFGLGFEVEIHKLVYACTKNRIAYVNLSDGSKYVKERQLRLRI
ncbi:MAG: VRR-NUC domain-containing protein [Candidatus Woesearchaeota archaeon]